VGALGTPLVFWLLLGSGMRYAMRAPAGAGDLDYLAYSFPGIIVLIVLFTAIFAMISIIEDRREGFMQGVLVAPISPLSMVAGKVLGSTALAVGQAALFMFLAPLAGISLSIFSVFASLGVLIILAVGLSSLGFLIAWPMDSTQGFHAVMNLFLMPMWLLSGAFFPPEGAATWIAWVIKVNPLTYGLRALRLTMDPSHAAPNDTLVWPLLISALFAVLMTALATRIIRKPR
jgi:ABC-2 type transport system permease protein